MLVELIAYVFADTIVTVLLESPFNDHDDAEQDDDCDEVHRDFRSIRSILRSVLAFSCSSRDFLLTSFCVPI